MSLLTHELGASRREDAFLNNACQPFRNMQRERERERERKREGERERERERDRIREIGRGREQRGVCERKRLRSSEGK